MNSQVADDDLNIERDLRNRLQDRWDLKQDPFAVRPDFFYEGAGRGHLLQQLRHLAGFGDRLLWIWGPPGIGKTRLIAEFRRLEQSALDIHVLDTTNLSSLAALTQQLRAITRERATAASAGFESLMAFFRWSQSVPGRGKRLVLVLDNAETVPPEILQGLLDGFAQSDRSLAALPVIVHSQSAEQTFAGAPDAGALACVHGMALPELTRTEVNDYLQAAFSVAGASSEFKLNKREVERIHAASKGNFGQIQRHCPAILLELSSAGMRAAKTARSVTKPAPAEASSNPRKGVGFWLLLAVLVLAGSFALIYLEYRGAPGAPQRETIRLQPQRMIHSGESKNQVKTSAASQSHPGLLIQETAKPPSNPVASRTYAGEQGATSAAAPQQARPASPADLLSKHSGAGPAGASAAPGPAPASATSAPPALSEPAPSRASQPASAVSAPLQTPAAGGTAKNAAKKSAEGFTPAQPAKYTPVEQLVKHPALVVQISGSYQEKSAIALMDRYPTLGMHYTRSEYHGKPWYVVYLGPFKDAAEAHRALAALPRRLRQAGPWIRSSKGF